MFGSLIFVGTYALVILMAQISFTMLDATGIFPGSVSILGISPLDILTSMMADIETMNADFASGSILSYAEGAWKFLWAGGKFILSFLLLSLTAVESILIGIGVPTEPVNIPRYMQAIVVALCIFDFAAACFRK